MNALALVTDAFGSSGGIAQYNRDLVSALAEIPGANRIIVLPRLGAGNCTALPRGVRQLKAQGNRLSYSLTALRAAVMLGPFDFVFCGHLHLAPLAALLASMLGVPLWLQLHGYEAWNDIKRAELVKRRLDRSAGAGCIGNVERYGADLISIALHQVSELNWIAGCGNELVSCGKHRFGKRTA